MNRAKYVVIAVIGLATAVAWGMRYVTYTSAEPWNTPSISPDKRFEIRYFSTFSPRRFLPTTPGQGADNIDGLIRLYDTRSGQKINETFRTHLSSREALWGTEEVIFLGDDGWVWTLPK